MAALRRGHDDGVDIRPCTASDVEIIEEHISTGSSRHHAARFAEQEAGHQTFLIAWDGAAPVGHVSVLVRSKYEAVNERHPRMREVNALGVWPPEVRRRGVATALMHEAERLAVAAGVPVVGLACEHDNTPALALYRRLGYEAWRHGDVVDEWTHVDEEGAVHVHRDSCEYYLKAL